MIDVVADFAGRPAVADQHDRCLAHGRRPARRAARRVGLLRREADFQVNPEADWDDRRRRRRQHRAGRAQLIQALKPYTVGTYLNFPGLLEEGEQQLRLSFGSHFDRLVEVKRQWDPDNLFRLNHNVRPRRREEAA